MNTELGQDHSPEAMARPCGSFQVLEEVEDIIKNVKRKLTTTSTMDQNDETLLERMAEIIAAGRIVNKVRIYLACGVTFFNAACHL